MVPEWAAGKNVITEPSKSYVSTGETTVQVSQSQQPDGTVSILTHTWTVESFVDSCLRRGPYVEEHRHIVLFEGDRIE